MLRSGLRLRLEKKLLFMKKIRFLLGVELVQSSFQLKLQHFIGLKQTSTVEEDSRIESLLI